MSIDAWVVVFLALVLTLLVYLLGWVRGAMYARRMFMGSKDDK